MKKEFLKIITEVYFFWGWGMGRISKGLRKNENVELKKIIPNLSLPFLQKNPQIFEGLWNLSI